MRCPRKGVNFNLCLRAIDDVRRYASGRLKAMQRRPRLIAAFWQQAELPL
jgi:hypothetical protein